MGNVTRDITLKYLQSGTAVAEIGLAINERYKNKQGEWVESTVFVDVSLFARTAEIANEYLRKGDPVFIEGKLKFDQWESDGQKRSKLKVIGERLQLLGGKRDGSGQGQSNGSSRSDRGEMQDEPAAYDGPPDEDIPF
jgi:single-strand DNA-binding protein